MRYLIIYFLDDKEKSEKKSSKIVDEVKTVVKTQSPEQNG